MVIPQIIIIIIIVIIIIIIDVMLNIFQADVIPS